MQVFNFTQQVKTYLSDKPQLLQRYVNLGYQVVNYALVPVNFTLKHLILVQGLDLDGKPSHKALQHIFDHTIHTSRGKYDHVWAQQKFEEARSKLKDLTQEEFSRLTDISKLECNPPTQSLKTSEDRSAFRAQVAAEAMDKVQAVAETLDVSTTDPVEDLSDFLKPAKMKESERFKAAKEDFDKADVNTLKSALKQVVDYSQGLSGSEALAGQKAETYVLQYQIQEAEKEATPDPKELFARTDYLRSVKKAINDFQQVGNEESLKEVVKKSPRRVKRVPTGRTDAVKNTTQHFTEGSTLKKSLLKKHKAAVDLVNDMLLRGLVSPNAVDAQVQEVLLFDEESFQSLKRVVERHPVEEKPSAENPPTSTRKANKKFKGNFRRSPKPKKYGEK